LGALASPAATLSALDLTHATVVGTSSKPVAMLIEEAEKRTGVRWALSNSPAAGANIVITQSKGPAEGYSIRVANGRVLVNGNDQRGVLFGVGRLLRAMRMTPGHATLDDLFTVVSAPAYPLRGHQLGYRPKTNSYDGWSLPVWEQYIRDLAVFGTNAVELIPPRSDDAPTSPLFPLPPMDMMIGMSKLLDEYGLDVWIWYPAMDPDYSKPEQVRAAVEEWADVFRRLPRVDAVFVPGGDPGHTQPKVLMALLEQQAASLRKYHPQAQMWVSPQGFSDEWMKEFLAILKKQQPAWLTGVVYGPQVRGTIQELRAAVPKRYALRHYPDITHSRQSQYPVPNWDTAYAITEGREGINPRPLDEAAIFRSTQPGTVGFIAYSEGCNDDVNKIVWSSLGWDPDANVRQIVEEYSRYFIGQKFGPTFAEGLFGLERNWQGVLRENSAVTGTLDLFRDMERRASPRDLANWRFQQGLYRAYYDAYIRERLNYETMLESQAIDALRMGDKDAANNYLDRAVNHSVFQEYRTRVFELAEALFKSIKMQLSVKLYQAIAVDRGANLDTIDVPLNDRLWLKKKIAEAKDQAALDALVNRRDPGADGFYDDLGVVGDQPHLVHDPATYVGFNYNAEWPMAWWNHAESLYDAPLRMLYTGLDPEGKYRLRVVYAGDSPRVKMRLTAGDPEIEVHPYLDKPSPMAPLEFDIPAAATHHGDLMLTWRREPGQGGNGRGNEVAEAWLMKVK
jgi:hypothetical protein